MRLGVRNRGPIVGRSVIDGAIRTTSWRRGTSPARLERERSTANPFRHRVHLFVARGHVLHALKVVGDNGAGATVFSFNQLTSGRSGAEGKSNRQTVRKLSHSKRMFLEGVVGTRGHRRTRVRVFVMVSLIL